MKAWSLNSFSPNVNIVTGSHIPCASQLHVFLPGHALEVSQDDRGYLGNGAGLAQVQLPLARKGMLAVALVSPVFEYRKVRVRPVVEYRTFRHGFHVYVHSSCGEAFDDEAGAPIFLSVGAHYHPGHADDGGVLLLIESFHT